MSIHRSGDRNLPRAGAQAALGESDEEDMLLFAVGTPVLTLANAVTWSLVAIQGALLFS